MEIFENIYYKSGNNSTVWNFRIFWTVLQMSFFGAKRACYNKDEFRGKKVEKLYLKIEMWTSSKYRYKSGDNPTSDWNNREQRTSSRGKKKNVFLETILLDLFPRPNRMRMFWVWMKLWYPLSPLQYRDLLSKNIWIVNMGVRTDHGKNSLF